ncbi:MAG TPA: hypothetical protein PKN61_06225 [Acidobacteriota bacterium]|nr:hypothetical protein [Acidobacteriota bacterium]HNU01190.1 hypothetical protein [Acidobacteriota bacterium]
MNTAHISAVRLLAGLTLLVGLAVFLGAQERGADRMDFAQISASIQRRGFADYIPVAYRTMGVESDYWGPADNHARAHFLLYMARDCSHFVLKWEIPALVALAQDPSPPREMQTEDYVRMGGVRPKSRLFTYEDKARNLALRSWQVGRLKRIWTRGPLNDLSDAAHARSGWSPEKWGALVSCALFLGSTTPIAAYATPAGEEGDPLSGGAILSISASHQRVLQAAARVKTLGPAAAPVTWRITADVFSAALLREKARLESVEMKIDLYGGAAVDVIGLFWLVAFPPSTAGQVAAEAVSMSISLALPDGIPNPIDPFDVAWFILKGVIFAPMDEMIGTLGKISVVRVGYMSQPEPFQVAPWTSVLLDGPGSGTDTWDAVELRGGYQDKKDYTWTVMAGACTDWVTRMSVRPSLIVNPRLSAPAPFMTETRPTQLAVQMRRDDANWAQVDKFLTEHIAGGVNAPVFCVTARPTVNYEVWDQEVIQARDIQTTESAGDRLTRRQLFHSGSACSGAVPLDFNEGGRFDFDRPHQEAVMVGGVALPVTVTFVGGVMPLGGEPFPPAKILLQPVEPLLSVGNNGKTVMAVDYEDTWWYVRVAAGKQRWEAQAEYRRQRRTDSLEYNRNRTRLALEGWRDRLDFRLDTRQGTLIYSPNARRYTANGAIGEQRIRYLPPYATLEFAEPAAWRRIGLTGPSAELADLEALDPCLTVEGNRAVLSFNSPRTGKRMTATVKIPAAGKTQKSN